MDNPIHMNKYKVPAIPMLNKLATRTQSLHHHKAHTATGAVELMVRAVQISQDPLPSWLFDPVGSGDVELSNLNASRDPNAILNECRDIDRGIDSIERNLERLRFLQTRAIDDPDASQGTQTNREIDALSSETMTLYRNFGARIKAIKQQRESGEPRNKPQVGKVDRKLKSAINDYQQVESDFRKKLSEQMARQYRIVKPEATDEEVRAAIEDTSNNQVFSQAVKKSLHFSLRGQILISHLATSK